LITVKKKNEYLKKIIFSDPIFNDDSIFLLLQAHLIFHRNKFLKINTEKILHLNSIIQAQQILERK
jgi:hypothetical protein